MSNVTMSNKSLEELIVEVKYLRSSFEEFRIQVVPRREIDLQLAEVKRDIEGIRLSVVALEAVVSNKKTWQLLGSNLVTAFLTGSMAALITYFVQTR